MAIYTTFFLCKQPELADGFPTWRPPLPQPVRRSFTNPFTGETKTIETREPEWPNNDGAEAVERGYQVLAIEGRYEDYLESRLSPFVRAKPHWCAKGLTPIELEPLLQAAGFNVEMESTLYCPPSLGALLMQFPANVCSKLSTLDEKDLEAVAKCWAAAMSTPEHTHSVTGEKLSDGWTVKEAMTILRPIAELARKVTGDQGMFVLIEC